MPSAFPVSVFSIIVVGYIEKIVINYSAVLVAVVYVQLSTRSAKFPCMLFHVP